MFGRANPANAARLIKFKTSSTSKPSETVAIADASGSNDPHECSPNGVGNDYKGDAAWLNGVWAVLSGPNQAPNGKNHRLQTAYAKHNKRVNVIYVDSHAAAALPSKLAWGQFYGVFDNGVLLLNNARPNSPISKAAFDAVEWSSKPE